MSDQNKLLAILSQLPSKYTPFESLKETLIKQHVISVHKPYLGTKPRNPRYQNA